jgi:hypothetical protein
VFSVALLGPSLAGAAALLFVLLSDELSASLLVRAPTTQVMGTILFDYWGNGSYPLVAAIALIMTAAHPSPRTFIRKTPPGRGSISAVMPAALHDDDLGVHVPDSPSSAASASAASQSIWPAHICSR